MIQVKDLSKVFGTHRAVDRISFEVESGEVLGFLGPNGAGKSTTMRMLSCFIPPTSGTATIGGYDIVQSPREVRQQIGYLPENAASYGEMLVEEFLRFTANVRGFSGADREKRIDRALELTSLQDVRRQMIETLSKGYRQRTCLAQSLLHDPPVLILDEPTDGLDPNQKHEVRQLIQRMREGRVILISTHILEEVDAVCSRAMIIANGTVVANGSPESLLAQSQYHGAVFARFQTSDAQKLVSSLQSLSGVRTVELQEETATSASFYLFPEAKQVLSPQVVQWAQEKQLVLEQMHVERGRFDDVFRKLTTNS